MIRSRRTAAGLCKALSSKPLNQFQSLFSTSTNPRKLIKTQSSLPQASSAFAYATQNLIGHVRMPVQFQVSNFGKTYWDVCTVPRKSDSISKPRWIPVLFQGETADSVSYHLKETEYAFIPGRVCAPSSARDQIEDAGHDEGRNHGRMLYKILRHGGITDWKSVAIKAPISSTKTPVKFCSFQGHLLGFSPDCHLLKERQVMEAEPKNP